MLNETEQIIIEHKDSLIILFTFALVFSGLASALATFINAIELRRQLKVQERLFLQSTLLQLKKIKYDMESSLYPEGKKEDIISDSIEFVQQEIYNINKKLKKE